MRNTTAQAIPRMLRITRAVSEGEKSGRPRKDESRTERVSSVRLSNNASIRSLEFESSRAGTELVDLRAIKLRDREQQICGRLLFGHDVTIALELALSAAEQESRRVTSVVKVAVTHTAAEINQ